MAVDASREFHVEKTASPNDRSGAERARQVHERHARIDSTVGASSSQHPVFSDDLPHFLSRAAQALSAEASTLLDTVRNTISSALPELGDFGFLDLVEDDQVRRVALAPQDPALQSRLGKTLSAPRWAEVNRRCALSSGASTLHTCAHDPASEDACATDDEQAATSPAFRSLISVPMRYRGSLVGALTLFMGRSGRTHSAQHLACAEELATVAAPIVVNSRLVEQHLVAREALQRSEEFLRTATEAGELGLWAWDLQSDRIVCSRRLYELHGLPPDAPGNRSADFISLVHPEDLPHVNARREAALSGAGDYVVEFRPIRPDGRTCWLSARAQVFRDAAGQPVRMIGATIDVTHRIELLARERSARAEAESARQRLELLATASASLSASLSPETTVKAITEVVVPQLADWCLVDLAGACGQAARMTLHHEDPQRARAGSVALQRLFASTPEVGSLAWCLIHGRPVRRNEWSATGPTSDSDAAMQSFARAIGLRSCCVVPLTARGRQIGVLAIFQTESAREITPADGALLEALAQRAAVALDNARLYTEAEDARRQAEDARRSAEDANKAKDAFLAMLGHELRNPLAPIVTNLKLMALRDDASSRAERIVIERQVGHLARLVDDLLDVARIAHGDVRLRRQRVLVKDILQRAIETVTPLLESRRHRLELDLRSHAAQAGELAVDADEHRLVQVFSNLLTNAARYTPDGGHIVLRTDSRDDACHIVVQDNGRGIEKDLLPRVFELFFQSEQGLDRADGGLGIGLAIVKNLVALHGGEVAAYSEGPGCGSSFVVRLPLASSPSPIEAIAAAVPAIPPATARKRILLVDDNLDALESMCILLELRGHDVRTAVDPIAALTLAASFSPDIAILDIGLPGMDGYDLAGRLRAGGSACRLLALTGYGLAEDRARSLAAGFELHLVKPVDPAALLDALE